MSNRNADQLDAQTLTDQEIFDRVCNHLAQQKRPSVFIDGRCAYRSGQLKCAAGIFIPDALYREEFEGASAIAKALQNVFVGVTEDKVESLLCDLQKAHDKSAKENISVLKDYLSSVAAKYNLTTKAIDNITRWYPIKEHN